MQKKKSNIIRFVRQSTGQDISKYDKDFFNRMLEKRMKETGLRLPDDYYTFIKAHPEEVKELIRSFNITYSEFFRDPLIFALLEQWILPSFFSKEKKTTKTEFRIWSVATAAGQEAYSIAMLFDTFKTLYDSDITVNIFASDICETEIAKAKAGLYPVDQMQKVPLKYINEYFYPKGKSYKLIPRIRESVDFFTYDILDLDTVSPPNSIYGSFDLIYCSNLFIYYNSKMRNRIIQKLKMNMTSNGILITGHSERDILEKGGLHAVCSPAAIFQQEKTQEYR